MNAADLISFRNWLDAKRRTADKNFMDAEEDSFEEERWHARGETLLDVIEMLDKLCPKQ
jgi:hypothetical protein